MTGQNGSEEDFETGAGLRARLEAEIARANTAEKNLASAIAGGFQNVKPEDLAGVPFGEMSAKAQEIETARKAEQEALVEQALKSKGLSEDQIAALLSSEGTPPPAPASQGVPEFVGRIQGSPPSPKSEFEGVVGPSRIRAAVANRT